MITNYIHKVLTFEDNKKYVVVNQAIYHGKNYILIVGVTPDGEDFTNAFTFFERIKEDGKFLIKEVTDPDVLALLAKNIKLD